MKALLAHNCLLTLTEYFTEYFDEGPACAYILTTTRYMVVVVVAVVAEVALVVMMTTVHDRNGSGIGHGHDEGVDDLVRISPLRSR